METPSPADFPRRLLQHREDNHRVAADFRSGRVIRLMPGWYVSTTVWREASPWQRTEITAAAVTLHQDVAIFSGITAVQLHGYPGRSVSRLLHLDQFAGGRRGRCVDPFAARGPAQDVPRPPVRMVHGRRAPWDGRPVRAGHFDTVPLSIALLEAAAFEPLTVSLPALDAVLRHAWLSQADPRPTELRARWRALADAWPVGTQARAARSVIDLADVRAESAMESRCRALFLIHGFQRPQLQAGFTDAQGEMRVDFFWPGAGVVVEYDGRGKWTDAGLATGRDQWNRIHRHNERHDRLMAQPDIRSVVHLTSEDLRDIADVVRRLETLGVPRDPRRALEFRHGPTQAA